MLIFVSHNPHLDRPFIDSICGKGKLEAGYNFFCWREILNDEQIDFSAQIIVVTSVGHERYATEENLTKIRDLTENEVLLLKPGTEIIFAIDRFSRGKN